MEHWATQIVSITVEKKKLKELLEYLSNLYYVDTSNDYKDELKSCFEDSSFSADFDDSGNLICMYKNNPDCINCDEFDFLEAITPFVKEGSYIMFTDAGGNCGDGIYIWRKYFDGEKAFDVIPQLIWPDLPYLTVKDE